MARPRKEFIMPTSEVEVKRIQDAIQELSDSMTREAAEKDFRKEAIKRLIEGDEENNIPGIDIPKGILTAMVKTYHASTFQTTVDANEKFEAAYRKIVGPIDPSAVIDE